MREANNDVLASNLCNLSSQLLLTAENEPSEVKNVGIFWSIFGQVPSSIPGVDIFPILSYNMIRIQANVTIFTTHFESRYLVCFPALLELL